MRYLSPKTDLTFKKVFGEHKHLLISFLNAVLPFSEEEEVVDLEYLSPEIVPETPMSRNSVVDVRCRDKKGRIFLIEMQLVWTDAFKQRVLFNASKAYVRQLDRGKEFKTLEPVLSLNLVDETYQRDTEAYFHHYRIVNLENSEDRIEGLEFVFVELPKVKVETLHAKRLHVLWLRFLNEISENMQEIPPEFLANPLIKEAIQHVEESSYSKAELEIYDKYLDYIRTERLIRDDSLRIGQQIGRVEGEQIGLLKGEQIGLKRGEQIGLQRGEQIGLQRGEQIGIYKKVLLNLRRGKDAESIAEVLDLPVAKVLELRLLIEKFADCAEEHL